MKTKDTSIKCIIDIRDIPPEAYSLPTDGRQKRHLCRQRRALALQLATYADADGSRIWPGVGTLARSLGLARRTVLYLLDDLRTLGFLEDGGLTGSANGGGGTRIRKLNLAKMIEAAGAGAQSSLERERNLGEARAQSSKARAQSSGAGAQSSIAHNRPSQPPLQPPTQTAQSNPTTKTGGDGMDGLENTPSAEEQKQNQNLPPEDLQLWKEMRTYNRNYLKFPDVMVCAFASKEEKRMVIDQIKTYGLETVVDAIDTWVDERQPPISERVTRWKAWLEEGGPLLQKP